ncbi:MAG TPA: lipopolysaccharide kinase InaA family protein [Pirellulales bacterium]|nr:lipopolysaccharide kinase InaA family protein [Pirellulales bacterium]
MHGGQFASSTHMWEAASARAVDWQVAPDWRDVLLGPVGLRLEEWITCGQAQLIKHGPRRAVYRVDAADHRFFVKHYRCPSWWQAARHLFQASAAQREYRRALETSRRQIPTVTPVAVGERRHHGLVYDNYLVTEAIGDCFSFDDYVRRVLPGFDRATQARLRRTLTVGLAKLCAAAHRAGVDHRDFHAGNLLVRVSHAAADGLAVPELFLIDLPSVRLSRGMSWRRAAAGLVMLGAAWSAIASRSDCWRFWRAYLRERPELRLADMRRTALQLIGRIGERRRRVARGRDRRSLGENRDFYRLREDGAAANAVRDLPADQLKRLLADPCEPLVNGLHRPYKLAHRSVVVEGRLPLDGETTRVAYKRVRPKNWWKALLFCFRRSPALEAWYFGHALLLRGIATARPLAVIERRWFGLRGESYLATQWIDGAVNLHLYAWRLAKRPPSERQRRTRQTAVALGRLVGRMHGWRVSHRDMKACNVLVVERPDGVDCSLIDADSVRIGRRLPGWLQALNLARLAVSLVAHPWVSNGDRLRFWRAYLSELSRGDSRWRRDDWKPLWRRVARAANTLEAKLRRQGRAVV